MTLRENILDKHSKKDFCNLQITFQKKTKKQYFNVLGILKKHSNSKRYILCENKVRIVLRSTFSKCLYDVICT